MRLILSLEANEELENLHTYITEVQQAPTQAADVMIQVYDSLDHIERNPFIGHPTDYPDTYEYVVPGQPLIVVYRIGGETLEVVTVFHTSQYQDKKRHS